MDVMTFEKIVAANERMHLTPIQNKEYAEVPQRVKGFRFLYPDGTIETTMISNENGICIFKAIARDATGKILSTGTAYEKEDAGFINKTSYIENCETSAVGRALGFLGLGIDTSIASFEEVSNAKEQQKSNTQKKPAKTEQDQRVDEASAKARVLSYINKNNMTADKIEAICKSYKVDKIEDLNLQQCNHYINFIKKNGGQI